MSFAEYASSQSTYTSPSLSDSIFSLSSEVVLYAKFVQSLGSDSDTVMNRTQMTKLGDAISQKIASISIKLKKESFANKLLKQKLTSDFESILLKYNALSKTAAQKSRDYIAKAHQVLLDMEHEDSHNEQEPLLQSRQESKDLVNLEYAIQYNETLIEEREVELEHIEKSVQQVNEIFRDLGTIVHEQQYMFDNIESNVASVTVNMENATGELRTANKYQMKSRNRLTWFLGIALVILLILVLSLKPWKWWSK